MYNRNVKSSKIWKRFRKSGIVFTISMFILFSGIVKAASQDKPLIQDETLFSQVLSVNKVSDEKLMSISFTKVPLVNALEILAERLNVGFSYNPEVIPNKIVSFEMSNVEAYEIIYKLLEGTNLEPVLPPSKDVIILREKIKTMEDYIIQVISGRVTDATTGVPLVGVTIIFQGTSTGIATDVNGVFELSVPEGSEVLIVSYIGYVTQTISIGNQSLFNIELQQDIAMLDDLVVVGYGVQRRSEITGSVGIVSPDELTPTSFNALQSLRGKVAGVQIFTNSGAPSGSNRVVIRGTGTINASTDPLFIVDGVAMEGGIQFLNPNDIASIEVLKDASATAIYGARGANGVILISTTRGGTQGGVNVFYDNNFSIGRMANKMDVMNAEEFMEVQRTAKANVPLWRNGFTDTAIDYSLDPDLFDGNGNPIYDTDWQDAATRTAFSQDHNFRIQGGTERSSLGAVLNLTNREGIFLNNYMDRYSIKLTYDVQPREWLTIGTNMTYSRIDENHLEEGGGGQEVRRTIIEMAPILPVTWPSGTAREGLYSNSTHARSLSLEGQSNPVHRLMDDTRLRERNQLFGNTYLAVQITPNLEFRTQLGLNNERFEQRRFESRTLIASGGFPDGRAQYTTQEVFYWQNENFLTYQQDFENSRLSAVLGASWQERRFNSFNQEVRGFPDDFFSFNNFGAGTRLFSPSSNAFEWTLNSYFNRITYTLDETFVFTFTSRLDGSSRFGADNKYGFFPSAGFAWNASNMDFISKIDFIDLLRFRTSYGVTGNTEIGVFNSLATIGSGTTLVGNERQSTSFTTRLPNPELEWEKTYQFNIGTDVKLFNNSIDVELDYYYKFTKDLLLARPVPATTGFTTILDNIGAVSNQGIDMKITTQNIRRSNLFWSTTLNFNYNRNRVERLGAGGEDIFPGPNWVSGSQTILRVGEPVGNFYGFVREGTWGTDEAAEAAARGFLPGEAKRSLNRTIIGNGLPDWTGSFINSVNFKQFDLLVDLQFVLGSDIMQQFLHTAEDRMALTNGLRIQLTDAWTENNQNTMYQRLRHQPLAGQNTQADSHWIVDGSYLRGNLIQLGYTFDPAFISNIGLTSLRVTTSVENVFVLHSSDFKGHDPEATSWGGNIHAQNIFFYSYPRPRTFSLGARLQF